MVAPMLNRLAPFLCFCAMMLASFMSAPSAKATMSDLHCAIQWEKIKTTRDKAVLNSHLRSCRESKSGGAASARLARLSKPDDPPPPPPPSRCDRLSQAAKSGREGDLQTFVSSCPAHLQYQTASRRLQKLLVSQQLAASTDTRLKLGIASYTKKEFPVAASHFEAACNQVPQMPAACAYLGGMYQTGTYVDKNPLRATALYEKSCRSGFLEACPSVAYIYQTGAAGVPVNQNKALEFLQIGCDGSDINSCVKFSAEISFKYIKPLLDEMVYKTLRKACDIDVARACVHSGLYQRVVLNDSSNKFEISKIILQYFDKSCTLGDMDGCYFVGNSYFSGEVSRSVNITEAKRFFSMVCQDTKWQNYYASCINLGVLLRDRPINAEKDVRSSVGYFKLSCDVKIAVGCLNLGFAYHTGKGVQLNLDSAISAYLSGCDGNQVAEAPENCENLAGIYYTRTQYFQSHKYFEKGCKFNLAKSCTNVGNLWEKGLGVARKDKLKAIEFYQKAIRLDAKQEYARSRLLALL